MSIPENGFSQDNGETDSDANSDVNSDAPAEYQPISASDDESEIDFPINHLSLQSNSGDFSFQSPTPNFQDLSNDLPHPENGISNLGLNEIGEKEEEEEEEDKVRESAESEIYRAFTEDESRRNAPLTAENASRVMDAMRGIVFHGGTPDWVDRVPEDEWVNQLRRLREPNSSHI